MAAETKIRVRDKNDAPACWMDFSRKPEKLRARSFLCEQEEVNATTVTGAAYLQYTLFPKPSGAGSNSDFGNNSAIF